MINSRREGVLKQSPAMYLDNVSLVSGESSYSKIALTEQGFFTTLTLNPDVLKIVASSIDMVDAVNDDMIAVSSVKVLLAVSSNGHG